MNRKERREADAAFARRVKARERRRVKAIKEGLAGAVVGTLFAIGVMWMILFADDPYVNSYDQPKFEAWNGQEYTISEYESMMQERAMYLEEDKCIWRQINENEDK